MNRLAYWLRVKRGKVEFRYDVTNGRGAAAEIYSILKDEVRVRTSQFGYVTGYKWMPRAEFEKLPLLEKKQ